MEPLFPLKKKQCRNCGVVFTTRRTVFCSRPCYVQYRNRLSNKVVCPDCGKPAKKIIYDLYECVNPKCLLIRFSVKPVFKSLRIHNRNRGIRTDRDLEVLPPIRVRAVVL